MKAHITITAEAELEGEALTNPELQRILGEAAITAINSQGVLHRLHVRDRKYKVQVTENVEAGV